MARASASTQLPEAGSARPSDGIVDWVAKGVTAAINAFFEGLVSAALKPLLDLLSHTLLATPTPDSLPRVGQLWTDSWQIAMACYSLLIMVAGILLMAHGTVQTRYSIRELGPRIPLGFLAAGLSLILAEKAVDLANAVSTAVLTGGLDKQSAGAALREFVFSSFDSNSGIFMVLMWGVVAVVLVALLVTYIVRVALTILLIAGAPLALMCHALPMTDGVARWWWRIFGGLLVIQVAQSMALIVAIRVFLTPGNFSPFGSTRNGFVSVLVVLGIMYILFKIPFWILGSARVGHGRSFAGRILRAAVAYRIFGMVRAAARGGADHGRQGRSRRHHVASMSSPGRGPAGIGAQRARSAGGGQRAGSSGVPRSAPGLPLFLAPNQTSRTTSSTRPSSPLPVPGLPTFLPPVSSPGQPIRPISRPSQARAAPRFQEPGAQTTPPVVRPLRTTRPPAPTVFRAPSLPANGPPPSRRATPPLPRDPFRPGGDRR
ncbi:hypothetical protein ACIBKX_07910 [Streptomyces sp. NPDC050658]|uniref:hypothetical protein n=1 Tax=unclassified Streptomyces TaxID=2593676 RepID=UPI00344A9CFE